MYSIAGHDLVDAGSHHDTDWGYSFAVRCYDCPDSADRDVIVYLDGEEEEDPADYRVDYRAMLGAVVDHVGPRSQLNHDDVTAAVLMCALRDSLPWQAGLQLLAEQSKARLS